MRKYRNYCAISAHFRNSAGAMIERKKNFDKYFCRTLTHKERFKYEEDYQEVSKRKMHTRCSNK